MIDQQKQSYIDKLNKELNRIIFIEENDGGKCCKANVCCVCDRLLRYNNVWYMVDYFYLRREPSRSISRFSASSPQSSKKS